MDHQDELVLLITNYLRSKRHADPESIAQAIVDDGWHRHPLPDECRPDQHIFYESCCVCGVIPEELD